MREAERVGEPAACCYSQDSWGTWLVLRLMQLSNIGRTQPWGRRRISAPKKSGCLKSSWRPSWLWWSSPPSTPSGHSLLWKQTTGTCNSAAQTVYVVTGQHADAKNCIILLDKDLCGLKQFWKVSFQNTESLLAIFSGQETKSYSQFTSVARHFISSKWTLCAQSIEAVYPGKYTKHWSSFCI